jgi:hypothetical protein
LIGFEAETFAENFRRYEAFEREFLRVANTCEYGWLNGHGRTITEFPAQLLRCLHHCHGEVQTNVEHLLVW